MENTILSYHDGIVEGRLVENGFFGIGSPLFVCRTVNSLYVVTYQRNSDSTLEVFQSISGQPDTEMEINAFVEWVRNDDYTANVLNIHGDIDDIIETIKFAKPHYK